MLDAVLWWLITPLTITLSFLLENLQNMTPNFAIAMIMLGVVMAILQQPFQAYARGLTQKEKKRQEQLQPLLGKIRRSYRAGERFSMIRTLYRQHHYHPVYALASSATLLLQLPFFLVAYLFLQKEGVVPSVAWGAIADLSLADGLLAAGRLNLLPFFMLTINLIACFYETRGQNFKSSWQLYLLALLFFVLLYQRSAAMLLYWSSSSATTLLFSILRNTGKISLSSWRTAELPTALFSRLRISNTWQLIIFILFVHQILLYIGFYRRGEATEFHYFLPIIPFMLYYSMLSWAAFYRTEKRKMVFLQSILFTVMLILILTTFFFEGSSFLARNLRRLALAFGFSMSIAALPSLLFFLHPFYHLIKDTTARHSFLLYSSSSAISCFLVFVFAPLQLFASLPSEGEKESWIINQFQLPRVVVLLILLLLFYTLFKKKRLLSYISCAFAMISLINLARPVQLSEGMLGLFLPSKIIQFHYSDIFLDVLSLIFVGTVLSFFIWRRWQRQLITIFSMIFISLVALSFHYKKQLVKEDYNFEQEPQPFSFNQNKEDYNFEQELQPFSFNQNKKNILVVFLDRFSSIMAQEIFTREKEIKAGFDGFTWYKNSFSQGRNTVSGFPPIYGGYDYDYTYNDKELTIQEAIFEAYQVTIDSFSDAGFKVDLFDPAQLEGSMNMSCGPLSGSDCHQLTPPNFAEKLDALKDNNPGISVLYYSLLRVSLSSLRYSQERFWLSFDILSKEISPFFIRLWEVMLHLPQMSRTEDKSQRKGNLLLFYNPAPHYPGNLDAQGDYNASMLKKEIPNELLDKFSAPEHAGHYYVAKASLEQLNSWWQWMKKNQVYDNTRIIVVADHGYYFDPDRKYAEFDIVDEKKEYSHNLSEFSILFMMKDFNLRGQLVVDNTFMSNGDTLHLAAKDLDVELKTPQGKALLAPKEAKSSLELYEINWKINYGEKIKDVHRPLLYRLNGGSNPEDIEVIAQR